MGKVIDLTGQKFGKWTVIERAKNKNGRICWLCRCECGETKEIQAHNLKKVKVEKCPYANEDLTGQKFNKLTVIKKVAIDNHEPIWLCRCECGNEKNIHTTMLKGGKIKSCGCLKKLDLTGQKFGKLAVIKRAQNKNGRIYWLCRCECGNEKEVLGTNLVSGAIVSCGCVRRNNMKQRADKQWKDDDFKRKHREAHWKGGISPISNYLRSLNEQWFEDCKRQAGYMCQLTGKQGGLNTHHLKGFNIIVREAHELYNIQIKEIVANYTKEEINLLQQYVASWHKDNSNAVVLCKEAHDLFHSLYGQGNNTPEQYMEFKERYLAGEFKEILK